MSKYSAVFFDLDHTLWDYEANSSETLHELYHHHQLQGRGVHTFADFHNRFREVNAQLWHLYDHGKITSEIIRQERFKKILQPFGVADEALTAQLSEEYLNECPKKGNLIPYAIETLEYLAGRYALAVITNGFEDVQRVKISSSGIGSYFTHIITSQRAGHKKPAPEIFHFALALYEATANNTVMIGDNLLTDMAGAKNASIDTVFFNPDGVEHDVAVNHEIRNLSELCTLL
ncbi:MAG: YjjG family noncanonical pyrimidine nucleotidase [Cyclobacteriaceae bacterium]|nr:YjjG family noncanonical pyrimidine nucleotidase [Cyclobacteriaceae bacterium]